MSLDRSLKSANALVRHRNVLTRAERLVRLKEQEKWSEEKNGVFGLPKVANRKLEVAKPVKEAAEGDAAAAGATPAAGAPAAAAAGKTPAAGAKAAAPAAGAKAAAPAAKKK